MVVFKNMPDPRRGGPHGEQHEAIMGAGETPESNTVFSTVVSARQALGENFKVEQVLQSTKFAALSEVEKAYLQRRLRKELSIELPEGLRVDEAALERAKAERASVVTAAKAPTPKPEPAELTAEQRIQGIASAIEQEFQSAQNMGEPFSVAEQMAMYKDALNDQERQMLTAEFTRRGVTDLSRAGAEIQEGVKVSTAVGKPPEQEKPRRVVGEEAEFNYRSGRLLWRRTFRYDDDTSKQDPDWGEVDPKDFSVVLPSEFNEVIASDPDKLRRAMEGLSELFRGTYRRSVKVQPVPREWKEQKRIDGFRVYFQKIRKAFPLPDDERIIEAVNATVASGGDYWDAPGFKAWRDREKERIVRGYVKEQVEEGLRSLGWGAEEAAAEPQAATRETPTAAVAGREAALRAGRGDAGLPGLKVSIRGGGVGQEPRPAGPEVTFQQVGSWLDQQYGKEVHRASSGQFMIGEFGKDEFIQGHSVPAEFRGLTEARWRDYLRQWCDTQEIRHPARAPEPARAARTAEPASPEPARAAGRARAESGPPLGPLLPKEGKTEAAPELDDEDVSQWLLANKLDEVAAAVFSGRKTLEQALADLRRPRDLAAVAQSDWQAGVADFEEDVAEEIREWRKEMPPYDEIKRDVDLRLGNEMFAVTEQGELVFGPDRSPVRKELERAFGPRDYPIGENRFAHEKLMQSYHQRWIDEKIAQLRQPILDKAQDIPVRPLSPEAQKDLLRKYNATLAALEQSYRDLESARQRAVGARLGSPEYVKALVALAEILPDESLALPGFPRDKAALYRDSAGTLGLALQEYESRLRDAIADGVALNKLRPAPSRPGGALTAEDINIARAAQGGAAVR